MKQNDIVVLTTAFRQDSSFTEDFFQSLKNQTRTDFDLLLLDDGAEGLESFVSRYSTLNVIQIPGKNNIAKNREELINSAIKMGYSKAVFADFDDRLSENRIEISAALLDVEVIVVNDVILFSGASVQPKGHFAGFLNEGQRVDLGLILESNFLGMSNTAVRLDNLNRVNFDSGLKAVDWFFFSSLLAEKKGAIFTGRCKTFYRQHSHNLSNIGKVSVEQLHNEIKVKKHHYSLMVNRAAEYKSLLLAVSDFCENLEDVSLANRIINDSKSKKTPFWWNIFNEKEYWIIKNEINKKS
ncbi:hypothetical protein ACES2L_07135 [Bdellovibrio bacteriovorus]